MTPHHNYSISVTSRMSVRSAYALDELTASRIKRLAATWEVSQAEVIRRSVQRTAEQLPDAMSPADVVARYVNGPLPRTEAEAARLVRTMREQRHQEDTRRSADSAK